jgi:hypothetical protein
LGSPCARRDRRAAAVEKLIGQSGGHLQATALARDPIGVYKDAFKTEPVRNIIAAVLSFSVRACVFRGGGGRPRLAS